MTRNFTFGLILALIFLVLLEALSFIVGNWFIPNRIIFNPKLPPDKAAAIVEFYDLYYQSRDPYTGLPLTDLSALGMDLKALTLKSAAELEEDEKKRRPTAFDNIGGRLSPAFPDPDAQKPCVSLFGDSFTYSSEVEDEFAWGNQLAIMLGCRVNNYGVGGLGSDQAFIRYTRNSVYAPVVFLNHLSENIMRNSTRYRTLVLGYDRSFNLLNFKPKFILDENGDLELIEIPKIDKSKFIDFFYNPEDYLEHEYFLPGGDSGVQRLNFPYTWTLINTVNHFHVNAKLKGQPWYMDFYNRDHASNGLFVAGAIMSEFTKIAKERGQQPVVSIIPTGSDLLYFRDHQVWPYQELIDLMAERNIDVLNFGSGMMERIGDQDPCSLFDNCKNHFNEDGYKMMAEVAYDYIKSKELSLDTAP